MQTLHGFKSPQFLTRCWLPIHHRQLSICISNPEGVKVPQFVILDKQQSVYQGLILSFLKLQGAWMGATLTWFSVMNSNTRWRDWPGKINEVKWDALVQLVSACQHGILHVIMLSRSVCEAWMNLCAQDEASQNFLVTAETVFIPIMKCAWSCLGLHVEPLHMEATCLLPVSVWDMWECVWRIGSINLGWRCLCCHRMGWCVLSDIGGKWQGGWSKSGSEQGGILLMHSLIFSSIGWLISTQTGGMCRNAGLDYLWPEMLHSGYHE